MSRPLTRAVLALTTVVTAACAGGGGAGSSSGTEPAGACMPTDATLTDGATLAGMAGSYRLVAVAPDGATAEGRMTLTERTSGQTSIGQTSLPLQGTAEIDFAAVGAAALPGMDSDDPARPGVLVLESDEEEGRRILVRFGMQANDLGQPAFDGSFTLLEPREISGNGFRGSWRSGGAAPSRSGHFCAWPA